MKDDNFKILNLSFSQLLSSQVKIYKQGNVSKFSSYAFAQQNPGCESIDKKFAPNRVENVFKHKRRRRRGGVEEWHSSAPRQRLPCAQASLKSYRRGASFESNMCRLRSRVPAFSGGNCHSAVTISGSSAIDKPF